VKLISASNKYTVVLVALIASSMLATSPAAQAATKSGRTLRVIEQGATYPGLCCNVWTDSIEVRQPEKPVPMIVTWSTDYRSTGPMLLGLRLNNGPCAFYGPAHLPAAAPANELLYASTTFQWVIMPGDYTLAKGPNTITVCGGGVEATDEIELGFYTLSVRLDKSVHQNK
jgi:hypothetical protein